MKQVNSMLPLEDRIFKLLKSAGCPLKADELADQLVMKNLVKATESGDIEEALAGDMRFSSWGSSGYWVLTEWQDCDCLYPFLRDRVRQILARTERAIHVRDLASIISETENMEISPEKLRCALELYWGNDIQGDRGAYLLGKGKRSVTITSAVMGCLDSVRLKTLDGICESVRRMYPEHDIKRKTVSGILSRKDECQRYFGAFWGPAGLSEEDARARIDFTGRQGFKHVVSEGQLRNGTLTVKVEYRPFLPDEDSEILLETEMRSFHKCFYRPVSGYISGMGPIYREIGLEPGDVVLLCSVSPERRWLWIERKREGISKKIEMILERIAAIDALMKAKRKERRNRGDRSGERAAG